ncbi:MAG TPA: DUF6029 family protein [Prolixibacteraceae bacterium]|nr:DUF6029 family protein [Prolixibacteraceae bacterium]
MRLSRFYILIFFCTGINPAFGQLSVFNLAEYQLGNIPGLEPQYVNSIYDQFNLGYRLKGFQASVRVENYYSDDSTRTHYTKFTQYNLSYRKKGLELKAGNFYETLGKGLLFRGYEIKNSVYEDQIYRVKQGFYRDTRGFAGSYSARHFRVKALRGRSLINQLPPTNPDNREDLVSAAEVNGNFFNQTAGLIFLQNENDRQKSQYLSALVGGTIFEKIDYYLELAHKVNDGQQFLRFGNNDSYGAYFNLNYSTSGFGLTLELKDYQNLFIGSGISDPPTLVKEHIYRLLNRSTHVPFYIDESGVQVEVFMVPADNHLITLNHSRSKNELGQDFQSAEYFADWQFTLENQDQLKFYIDYSFDDILFESSRYASGLYYTKLLAKSWSVSLETEFQQIERTFDETNAYQNIYAGLVFNKSTRFSAALIWEFTNDTKVADLPSTDEVEEIQNYPGINLLYRPNRKNTVQLFAGKRRGGPACTSGICYEVLDFKGLEIRWSTKF